MGAFSMSTGRFTLCPGFFGRMEVMEFLFADGPGRIAALGHWMMLGSYHAAYPGYDIPYASRRLCDGKPRYTKALIEHGFLFDTGRRGWRLGYQGDLWSITYGRDGNRQPIRPDVRDAVYERDGMACVLCGATEDLTLDHIMPWSHGGPDTATNLRVLCRSCNSSRGNRAEATDGA